VKDPSTEAWRDTFAAAGASTSARLRDAIAEVNELTRVLLETRQALIASQADLTRAEADTANAISACAEAVAEREALAVLNAELKAEATALRQLNEKES
jgi:hypothetical protein